MFKYKSVEKQIRDTQKENILLRQELAQTTANLEFIAIMTDVEIPEEKEDE